MLLARGDPPDSYTSPHIDDDENHDDDDEDDESGEQGETDESGESKDILSQKIHFSKVRKVS